MSLYTHAANELKRAIVWFFGFKQIVTLDYFGQVRVLVSSKNEASRILAYGFELDVLAAFLFMLDENDIVWDVGASTGLYSIHAARIVESAVAFEPDPEAVARLKQNVVLNRLEEIVKVMPLAIGAVEGVTELATDGLSGYAPVMRDPGLGRHAGSVKVEVRTIDSLVAEGLEPPTVLKIDIEGAEGLALQGAQVLLGGHKRPRIVLVEVHKEFIDKFGGSLGSVLDKLTQCRYICSVSRQRSKEVHVLAVAEQTDSQQFCH